MFCIDLLNAQFILIACLNIIVKALVGYAIKNLWSMYTQRQMLLAAITVSRTITISIDENFSN